MSTGCEETGLAYAGAADQGDDRAGAARAGVGSRTDGGIGVAQGDAGSQTGDRIGIAQGDAGNQTVGAIGIAQGDAGNQTVGAIGVTQGDAGNQTVGRIGGTHRDAGNQTVGAIGGTQGDAGNQTVGRIGGTQGDAGNQTVDRIGGTHGNAGNQTVGRIGGTHRDAGSQSRGRTIWLTGLSGAGKSTIASLLTDRLTGHGFAAEWLDGDELRRALGKGLGFSRNDRFENIRRAVYLAGMLNRHGVTAIVSVISPYTDMRDYARQSLPGFAEIYVDCPLEICETRDVKGLYAKARRGEIPAFTGISDPYETPLSPELTLRTAEQTPEESVNEIWNWLTEQSLTRA